LKDLIGKPRPDLIARCNPDLSRIKASTVGGLGLSFEESPIMVDVSICQQTNAHVLNDGFAAFPSGHSSFSSAGLLYFSLWLAAKLSVWIPQAIAERQSQGDRESQSSSAGQRDASSTSSAPSRHQAASPPLYLLAIVATPVIGALYICATRYADYHHAGFDIISGAVIGGTFAVLSFRYYHLPLHQGWGWSWGPRSRDRAFFAPSWSDGFVGGEGWLSKRHSRERQNYEDLELGELRPTLSSSRPAS
jgi:membrane-associated phospholipid phosphatase